MSRRHLQGLIAIILAGLWGFNVYFAHSQGRLRSLDRAEAAITDLRTLVRGVRAPPDFVTIVAIDDDLVKQGGSYPLARIDLARLVDAIARLGPKVIAIDLLLVDKGADNGDQALAKSLARRPTVIAAAAVFPEASQSVSAENDEGPLASLPTAERLLLPLKIFADQASIGIVNVATDRTGTPRFIPALFRTSDRLEMSFPLRVAALAIGKEPLVEPDRLILGQRSVATDVGHALPITFYGPRGTIRTMSAAAVLGGEINPNDIQNRIVVVGTTVTGGGDFFSTPFEPVMPGVEILSTAIIHLMAGDGMLHGRSVRIADGIICVVLPMVLVGLLAWRRTGAGLVAAACAVAIWTVAIFFAFSSGIWLSAAVPVAATAPPIILFAAVQLWSGRRRAQYFAIRTELLQQFQAPVVQEWLAKDPDFLSKPVRQNAAIVFIDLSGFTALSERLGPDRTRELLKDFHDLVDREVVICGGMITSFAGDGAMILFGLPEAAPDDALRAADCSARLCVGVKQWLTSLTPAIGSGPEFPKPEFPIPGFKVGAHYGITVASRLGGGSHHHITATGDTVNVASRLMEVADDCGVELAVSNELLLAAGPDCALFKSGILKGPNETRIRGRSASLAIWLWRSDLSPAGGDGLADAA